MEDRLLRDKTPESFDRVFDTKVVSARVLAERLRPEDLRFCAFFTSIASRYGNKGQSDYAASNEVLSKLALALDRLGADYRINRLEGQLGPKLLYPQALTAELAKRGYSKGDIANILSGNLIRVFDQVLP